MLICCANSPFVTICRLVLIAKKASEMQLLYSITCSNISKAEGANAAINYPREVIACFSDALCDLAAAIQKTKSHWNMLGSSIASGLQRQENT